MRGGLGLCVCLPLPASLLQILPGLPVGGALFQPARLPSGFRRNKPRGGDVGVAPIGQFPQLGLALRKLAPQRLQALFQILQTLLLQRPLLAQRLDGLALTPRVPARLFQRRFRLFRGAQRAFLPLLQPLGILADLFQPGPAPVPVRQPPGRALAQPLLSQTLAARLLLFRRFIQLPQPRFVSRQLRRGLLALFAQGFKRGLLGVQSRLGGADVQGLISGHRRVLAGAAQRAGFARPQSGPVLLQAENAPFLFQQPPFVRRLLLRLSIIGAQPLQVRVMAGMFGFQRSPLLAPAGQPRFQRLQFGGQRRQAAQNRGLPQRELPLLAPFGQAAAVQRRAPVLFRPPQLVGGLEASPLLRLDFRAQGRQVPPLTQCLRVQFRNARGAAVALLAQPFLLFEAGAPAFQQFAQTSVMPQTPGGRLLLIRHGLERVQTRAFSPLQPTGQAQGSPVAGLPVGVQRRLFLPQRLALRLQTPQFRPRLFHFAPLRLDAPRRFVATQTRQLRLRLRFSLAGFPPFAVGFRALTPRLLKSFAPLPLLARQFPIRLRLTRGRAKLGQPRFHFLTLLRRQQFHPVGARLPLLQGLTGIAGAFKHLLRDHPVDFAAGQFLQQFGPRIGVGIEEGGKAALRQQHGFGEALVIQPGDGFDALELVRHLAAEDLAVGFRQLHLGRLQRAVRLVARAALTPEGAVTPAFDFELHLRQAVRGVPAHDVVAALGHGVQPRRLVVKRQADGVQQCGFAGAGGAGDGEQPAAGEGFGAEVQLPLSLQRIEVFQAQGQDFHACSSCSEARISR